MFLIVFSFSLFDRDMSCAGGFAFGKTAHVMQPMQAQVDQWDKIEEVSDPDNRVFTQVTMGVSAAAVVVLVYYQTAAFL